MAENTITLEEAKEAAQKLLNYLNDNEVIVDDTPIDTVVTLDTPYYLDIIGNYNNVDSFTQKFTKNGTIDLTYQRLRKATDEGNGVFKFTKDTTGFGGANSNETLTKGGDYVEAILTNDFVGNNDFYFGISKDLTTTSWINIDYGVKFIGSSNPIIWTAENNTWTELVNVPPLQIGDSVKVKVEVNGDVVVLINDVIRHTFNTKIAVTGTSTTDGEEIPNPNVEKLAKELNIDLDTFNIILKKLGKFGGIGIGNVKIPRALLHLCNDDDLDENGNEFPPIDVARLGNANSDVIIEGRNNQDYHGFRWIHRTNQSCSHLIFGRESDYWEAEIDYDYPAEQIAIRVPYTGKTPDARPQTAAVFKKEGMFGLGRNFQSPQAVLHLKDDTGKEKVIWEDLPKLKTGLNLIGVDVNGKIRQAEIKIFNSKADAIADGLSVGDVYEAGSNHLGIAEGVLITVR